MNVKVSKGIHVVVLKEYLSHTGKDVLEMAKTAVKSCTIEARPPSNNLTGNIYIGLKKSLVVGIREPVLIEKHINGAFGLFKGIC